MTTTARSQSFARFAPMTHGTSVKLATLAPLLLLVWILSLATIPVYILEDGSPQIFHLISIVLMILVFPYTVARLKKEADLIISALAFSTYAIYINGIWFGLTASSSFIWSSIYYCYNFALFFLVVIMAKDLGNAFISATRVGIAAGIVLQIVAVLGNFREEFAGGAVGTFTNPNQLGYWAMVSIASYLILQERQKLTISDCIVLASALWLIAISLSRAAIGAVGVLVLAGVILQQLRAGAFVIAGVALVAAMAIIWAGSDFLGESALWQKVVAEMERHSQYDNLHGRGYDRIWQFDQYLLFGAGEGGYGRFATSPYYFFNELHSAFGNILFSYGIIGSIFFSTFMVAMFRRVSWRACAYALPVLLFGVAHNSFRFSACWIFFGLLYSIGGTTLRRASEQDPAMVQNCGLLRFHFVERQRQRLREILALRWNRQSPVAGKSEGYDEPSTVPVPAAELSSADEDIWLVDRAGVVLIGWRSPGVRGAGGAEPAGVGRRRQWVNQDADLATQGSEGRP